MSFEKAELPKNITDDGHNLTIRMYGSVAKFFGTLTLISTFLATVVSIGLVFIYQIYALLGGVVILIVITILAFKFFGGLANSKIELANGMVKGKKMFSSKWENIFQLTNPEEQLSIESSKFNTGKGSIETIDLVLKKEDGQLYKLWSHPHSQGAYSAVEIRKYMLSRLGSQSSA